MANLTAASPSIVTLRSRSLSQNRKPTAKSLDLRVSSVILAHFPVGLHENPFPKDFWPVSPLIFVKYAYIRLKNSSGKNLIPPIHGFHPSG